MPHHNNAMIYATFIVTTSLVNVALYGQCYVTQTDMADNIGCKRPPVLLYCNPLVTTCDGFGDPCGTPLNPKTVDIGVRYADPGESGYNFYQQSDDICWQTGKCACDTAKMGGFVCKVPDDNKWTDYPGYTWPDWEADPQSGTCNGGGGG